MAAGYTNRGLNNILKGYFQGVDLPSTFYLGLVQKQYEKSLDAAAAVDNGGGLVGIPVTAHGFATDDRVRIAGTTNYDGSYYVDSTSSANEVVITATYNAETLNATQKIWVAPGKKTNILDDLAQIATGNGYADGGIAVARNATSFINLTEDNVNWDADIELADVTVSAVGGGIPSSGNGAWSAVLLEDNATEADREVIAYGDLTAELSLSSGETTLLQDLVLKLAT